MVSPKMIPLNEVDPVVIRSRPPRRPRLASLAARVGLNGFYASLAGHARRTPVPGWCRG